VIRLLRSVCHRFSVVIAHPELDQAEAVAGARGGSAAPKVESRAPAIASASSVFASQNSELPAEAGRGGGGEASDPLPPHRPGNGAEALSRSIETGASSLKDPHCPAGAVVFAEGQPGGRLSVLLRAGPWCEFERRRIASQMTRQRFASYLISAALARPEIVDPGQSARRPVEDGPWNRLPAAESLF